MIMKRIAPVLYIIKQEPNGPFKIGITDDIPKRIKSLQTGNPNPLKLHHNLRPGLITAREIETLMKRRLKKHQLMGEWYDLPLRRLVEEAEKVKDLLTHKKLNRQKKTESLYMDEGIPCSKGHTSGRYRSTGGCVDCAKESAKKWKEENPDRFREYQNEYEYRRKKQLSQATPKWANTGILTRMEKEAREFKKGHGVHIGVYFHIPLKHGKVCGLYLPENVELASKTYRRGRGRGFDQDAASVEHMNWLRERGLCSRKIRV